MEKEKSFKQKKEKALADDVKIVVNNIPISIFIYLTDLRLISKAIGCKIEPKIASDCI